MKPLKLLLFLLSLQLHAQLPGCTDPLSKNFNPQATVNDGSCLYASVSVKAEFSTGLPPELVETSGLIYWGDNLYTHNDDTDTTLYAIDTLSGTIAKRIEIPGVKNQDWEEIAHDSTHIYIGDFGNNGTGRRDNLNIIRLSKDSLAVGRPDVQYINFSYSNQDLTVPKSKDKTDFDCEAMVISGDSIYLFTKQWNSRKTSLYALPKIPGTYAAQYRNTYDVDGLITGATYLQDKNLVVLTGYSMTLRPFFYLLYDFTDNDFFGGNKRKVNMSLRFHQVEGIATNDGMHYYITNEATVKKPIVNTKQQLHKFDLSGYLSEYFLRKEAVTRRK